MKAGIGGSVDRQQLDRVLNPADGRFHGRARVLDLALALVFDVGPRDLQPPVLGGLYVGDHDLLGLIVEVGAV